MRSTRPCGALVGMVARLVVSLSGIGSASVGPSSELAGELDRRGVPLSLLLAPAHVRRGEALDWVRSRLDGGDALVQHGFDHRDDPFALRRRAEFAVLPAHEAGLRLVAARAAFARHGLATDVFAPPSWVVSPGALLALARHRFAVCADLAGVRDLRTGRHVESRVRGGGPKGLAAALRRGGVVRIGVDAADLPGLRGAVLGAVDVVLAHGADPTTYADLMTGSDLGRLTRR
ncbi:MULTISPECIES: DUF2334 domain-containing protein [Actinosynnema]|nr:DUF2334 domain-containing protein [Actinosynnema pretiosum]